MTCGCSTCSTWSGGSQRLQVGQAVRLAGSHAAAHAVLNLHCFMLRMLRCSLCLQILVAFCITEHVAVERIRYGVADGWLHVVLHGAVLQARGPLIAAAMQQRWLGISYLCMAALMRMASTWLTCGAWTCRPGSGGSAVQHRVVKAHPALPLAAHTPWKWLMAATCCCMAVTTAPACWLTPGSMTRSAAGGLLWTCKPLHLRCQCLVHCTPSPAWASALCCLAAKVPWGSWVMSACWSALHCSRGCCCSTSSRLARHSCCAASSVVLSWLLTWQAAAQSCRKPSGSCRQPVSGSASSARKPQLPAGAAVSWSVSCRRPGQLQLQPSWGCSR
ncbi:hypothetical protein COO60DRAFT_858850 [Scenedesmus sp. NREL 46B-D3]|nr:hypothetical protein COO60DRAFT_858850 [Scenedesmus sp. NREL 46B-D3]